MPETEAICNAYGLPYVRCEDRSQLQSVLTQVLAQKGPVLCEVMAQHNQKILPGVPSYLLEDGSMRSRALHQMAPDIGVTFDEVYTAAEFE